MAIQEGTMMATGKIESWMTLFGHPMHPMFVHIPAAAFVGVIATDAAYWYNADPFWSRASILLLGAGSFVGAVAAIIGWIDQTVAPDIRRLISASCHGVMGIMLLATATANWVLRILYPMETVLYWALYLTILTSVQTILTSWLGGQLVYEYGVGVDRKA